MALYAYPSCSTASLSFIRVPFCEQAARSSVFLAPPRSYSLFVHLLQRNLPPFLSLFRLFRPLSLSLFLSLSLLVYITACSIPPRTLFTNPPPLCRRWFPTSTPLDPFPCLSAPRHFPIPLAGTTVLCAPP